MLTVFRSALLLGLLAAATGAGVGYFSSEASWAGALRGLNWASLALAVYAGMIVVGHSQTRQVDRNVNLQLENVGAGLNDVYPGGTILTAFLASLTCAALWFLLRAAIPS